MEVWDDDDDYYCAQAYGCDDLIDNFTIAMLSSQFNFNEANSLTAHGTNGIGILSLVFYNLTTNPTPCISGDILTPSNGSLVPGGNLMTSICHLYH